MSSSSPPDGDMMIRDGIVYTADPKGTIYDPGSVLILNGSIAAVGATADVDAALAMREDVTEDLRVLDARGSMVLPGFVNPHWHDIFAARLSPAAALRPGLDTHDEPGFLARGGDMHRISATFDKFGALVPALRGDEAEAIARFAVWSQLRTGVTTLGDTGSLNRPDALLSAVLGVGIRATLTTWAADVVCEPGHDVPRRTQDADELLRDVEALLSECAAEPTGRIRAHPTTVYSTNMSDELAEGMAKLVDRYDTRFTTHLGAQRHERAFVERYFGASPVHRFARSGLLTDRFTAVHCAFVDEDEYKLLAESGVHVNHSPAKYGSSGESTLTETKVISRMIRDGFDVSLSTDGTSLQVGGMTENMRAAWQGHNEIAADHSAVPPTVGLSMATRLAARALGREDEVGSLQVGKQGDAVLIPTNDWRYVLNPRPLEAFLTLGSSQDVDTVVVGGQVVLERGASTLVEGADVEEQFLHALRSFSTRIHGADPRALDAALVADQNRRGSSLRSYGRSVR